MKLVTETYMRKIVDRMHSMNGIVNDKIVLRNSNKMQQRGKKGQF